MIEIMNPWRIVPCGALLAIALHLGAAPALADATTATTATYLNLAMQPPDGAVTNKALEWMERIQAGSIDRTQLEPAINAKFSPQTVSLLEKSLSPLGKPYSIAFGGSKPVGATMVYRYVVVFANGAVEEYISLDRSGKIAGLVFSK
jgi:hypothetical protein